VSCYIGFILAAIFVPLLLTESLTDSSGPDRYAPPLDSHCPGSSLQDGLRNSAPEIILPECSVQLPPVVWVLFVNNPLHDQSPNRSCEDYLCYGDVSLVIRLV
jgi:hypothetical protein